jgi:hypothetical protein
LVLLESIFPWDFSNCAYASRVNITSYDADRDNMAERNHAEKLPWVSDDRALHKLACENLEQLIRKTFASNADMDSALANFRTQCTFACESNFDLSNHGKARILRRIKRRINEWIK